MKKSILGFLIVLCSSPIAADVVLVYPNEQAVKDGKSILGMVTSDGVTVSATFALDAGKNLLIGPLGQPLRQGTLIRLDNDLDLAVMRPTASIENAALNQAHLKKSESVSRFLAVSASAPLPAFSSESNASSSIPDAVPSDSPVQLLINQADIASGSITLPVRFQKSKFTLDLVWVSSSPVWKLGFEVSSEPKLSFGRSKRSVDSSDIPRAKFRFEEQSFFKPYSSKNPLTVPIDVYYVKEADYVLTFKVLSKGGPIERKVKVRFGE